MNANQRRLYFTEWSQCRKALAHHNPHADTAEIEEKRHEMHVRALGYDKSSAKLSNDEFDRVLAVFRSFSRPADLGAQLRQQDQPITRCFALANDTLDRIGEVYGPKQRRAYLEGMARRMIKKPLDDLTTQEWAKLLAALNYQARRAAAKPQPSAA